MLKCDRILKSDVMTIQIRILPNPDIPGNTMHAKGRHTGTYYFWIGMLIPVLLAGIGFITIGIWPFGDGTVLIIDSLHQYLPISWIYAFS